MHKLPQKSHLLFRLHLDTLLRVAPSLLLKVVVRVHVHTGFFLASSLHIGARMPCDAEPCRELKRHVGIQAGGLAPSAIPAATVLVRLPAAVRICRVQARVSAGRGPAARGRCMGDAPHIKGLHAMALSQPDSTSKL